MSETRRKLTTIFSADVHGYSRMMEADEERTLARLKRLRDTMARLITAHSGRVVNTWGDGLLAEFSSVVEAVRAAVDIQNELARIDGSDDGEPMLFRIGINLGDVIADGDNIYGDGVNIAARLQESAAPGGILISRTVYDQVRNKVSVGFDFLGDLAVKNLQEAVPSYAIRIGGRDMPPDQPLKPIAPPLPVGRKARNGSQFVSTRFGAVPRRVASLALAALIVLVVNLATWNGTFWAVWPLLGLAILGGFRWIMQPRTPER